MDTYLYFIEKAQAEFLDRFKKSQDLGASTLATVAKVFEDGYGQAKTPTELIERSFDVTSKLLDVQKTYTLGLASLLRAE
jgi:hypothetical protein